MSTSEKIEQRISSISSTIDDYVRRLLDLCESEIEKLFFANLIYYVFYHQYKYRTGGEIFDDKYNGMFAGFVELYTYDEAGIEYYLYGITFEDRYTFNNVSYRYSYKIIPQHCVDIGTKEYRIDFGIICKSYVDNSLKKEIKIAIECDGFEFHSSKEDLQRDTSRNRNLTLEGWKVYRYSGSEIYRMSTDDQIEILLREIRKLAEWKSFL